MVVSNSTSIKQLENQIVQISIVLSDKTKGGLPSDMVVVSKK